MKAMLILSCGKNVAQLGIRHSEGWNITRFIDHLDACGKCNKARATLIVQLNFLIGSGARPLRGKLS
jgi:hypothetical protein